MSFGGDTGESFLLYCLGETVCAEINSMRNCWMFCCEVIVSCAVYAGDIVGSRRRFEFDQRGLGATLVLTGGGPVCRCIMVGWGACDS